MYVCELGQLIEYQFYICLNQFLRLRARWAVDPWPLEPSTPKSWKEEARHRRTHLSGMPWMCSVADRTFPTTKWPTCWPTPNLTWTIPFLVIFQTWRVSAASTWNRLDITPTLTIGTWTPKSKHFVFMEKPDGDKFNFPTKIRFFKIFADARSSVVATSTALKQVICVQIKR